MSFFKNGSQFRHLWHPEHFRSLPPRLGEVCGRPLSPQVSSSQNLQWLRRGAGGGDNDSAHLHSVCMAGLTGTLRRPRKCFS